MRDNIADCIAADVGAEDTPAGNHDLMMMSASWNDVVLGKPYPHDRHGPNAHAYRVEPGLQAKGFDTWETNDQINYEIGRRAAAAASRFGEVPFWGKNATTDVLAKRMTKKAMAAAEEESAWGLYTPPPPSPISHETAMIVADGIASRVIVPSEVRALLERLTGRRH